MDDIGSAGRMLGDALKTLGRCLFMLIKLLAIAIREAALILCRFSQQITWFIISAVTISIDIACLPKLYEGFERWPGDYTAILPTVAIIALPLVFVVEYGWFGVLAAGMLTLLITGFLLMLGWFGQVVLVAGTLAALTFYNLQDKIEESDNDEEYTVAVDTGSTGSDPDHFYGEPDV